MPSALTAALLAEDLKADFLLILTDVPNVYADCGTPDQEPLLDATPEDLRRGRFPDGSMGPKTEAAARFVERTGGLAAIGALVEARQRPFSGTVGTDGPSRTRPCPAEDGLPLKDLLRWAKDGLDDVSERRFP